MKSSNELPAATGEFSLRLPPNGHTNIWAVGHAIDMAPPVIDQQDETFFVFIATRPLQNCGKPRQDGSPGYPTTKSRWFANEFQNFIHKIWEELKAMHIFCHWSVLVAPKNNGHGGRLFDIGVEGTRMRHHVVEWQQEPGWTLLHIGHTGLEYHEIENTRELAQERPFNIHLN